MHIQKHKLHIPSNYTLKKRLESGSLSSNHFSMVEHGGTTVYRNKSFLFLSPPLFPPLLPLLYRSPRVEYISNPN